MNHYRTVLCIVLLQVSACLSQESTRKPGLDRNVQRSASELVKIQPRRGQSMGQRLAEDTNRGLVEYDKEKEVVKRKDDEQSLKPTNIVINEVYGEPIPKTAWIRCETEKSCTTSQVITHRVTLTSRKKISSEFSLVLFKVTGDVFDLSNCTSSGVSTSYSFTLDSPSEGRLMFTPRLVEISGKYNKSEFALLAPRKSFSSEGVDHVDGTWWVQYKPDHEPVDDVNFYNIRHKDTKEEWNVDDKKLGTSSGSPRMCAESALRRGFNFAVWDHGECRFKQTVKRNGRLTTADAKPIGNYYLPIPSRIFVGSLHPEVRDSWVKQGQCDLISEIEGKGFYCDLFVDSPTAVMMFRRSSEYMGVAGDKSRSNATYSPETADAEPLDEENFVNFRHKDIPIEAYTDVDKLPTWYKSPKSCAQTARKRGAHFAYWYDGSCWLKRLEEGEARLTGGAGRPIGNYKFAMPNSRTSCSSDERDEWVAERECDLIQELDGCYQCKKLLDSQDGVVMLRRTREYLG